MSLITRRRILAARIGLVVGTALLRGRARMAAWAAHEALRIIPSVARNHDWHGPVARAFRTEKKEVWLTIDDGPDPSTTPAILDLLDSAGAKASFFVIGKKVDWNRALAARIAREGHTLENHTYSHPSAFFWALPSCAILPEIVRCNHAIRVATGTSPTWFRSPVGMTNANVHPIASSSWLRLAGWSADGLDGLPGRDPQHVVDRILARLRPGAVLLVHEGGDRPAAEVVARLLRGLGEAGFACVIPRTADWE